tara:strand:- start:143 stop:505 length:363 start_codon:yes stop_codon:yes gene_type:complete
MASKWQVDKETSKAKPNETEFEKVKRLRKRVAWNLEINEEEKNLLNKYESKKTKESFVSESDYAEKVWDAAVKGFDYPEMDPIYNNRVHIPSGKEVKTGKRGGRYTEDITKDGRPYRRYF